MPAFSLATLIRALLVWLLIMAAESVHGALRRVLLTPEVDFAVRQISVAVAALIIFALTWVFLDWIRVRSVRGALVLVIVWAGLTLAFELALGRLTGTPWVRIRSGH